MSQSSRLDARLAFLAEADRLKTVERASRITGNVRRENSGEHSWHVALYAMVLGADAPPGVSIDRVIRMLLIHDLVEIDTGDTPIHAHGGGAHGSADVFAAEEAAASRIFGLLPPEQARAFRALWDEFEAASTPDAVFAKSIDRLQPVMLNLENEGGTWVDYAVTREQLETRVGSRIRRGLPMVWDHLSARLDRWFGPRG